MEQISEELHPAPGQLWRNVRTGDVLFIYRKNGQIEGVFGNGQKKNDHEVMKIANCGYGWTCVFQQAGGRDNKAHQPESYEFGAL